MHTVITGGTGFIGAALASRLTARGDTVTILSRQPADDEGAVRYIRSLDALADDAAVDAVINLAGAPLAGRRWNSAYKEQIVASRIETTRAVVALCARLVSPPEVLLSASAIGYYGPHKDEKLNEISPSNHCFSSELCQLWEKEARAAEAFGVRVCLLRLGVVLDRDGGAMTEMARPFKLGLANWIGSGEQWLSWVHREDVLAAIQWLLQLPEASGAYNLTAPEPVTSRGFCDAMKRHTRTLLTLPMPAAVMRFMVGEVADELLITGQRVLPARLLDEGFAFRFADIDAALQDILD